MLINYSEFEADYIASEVSELVHSSHLAKLINLYRNYLMSGFKLIKWENTIYVGVI